MTTLREAGLRPPRPILGGPATGAFPSPFSKDQATTINDRSFFGVAPAGGSAFGQICIGEVWHTITEVQIVIGGAWHTVTEIQIVQGGAWYSLVA